MKLNLKTLLIIIFIGSLSYLYQTYIQYKKISNKHNISIEQKDESQNIIDKKSSKLPTPKALDFIREHQNKLEIGDNWRSR